MAGGWWTDLTPQRGHYASGKVPWAGPGCKRGRERRARALDVSGAGERRGGVRKGQSQEGRSVSPLPSRACQGEAGGKAGLWSLSLGSHLTVSPFLRGPWGSRLSGPSPTRPLRHRGSAGLRGEQEMSPKTPARRGQDSTSRLPCPAPLAQPSLALGLPQGQPDHGLFSSVEVWVPLQGIPSPRARGGWGAGPGCSGGGCDWAHVPPPRGTAGRLLMTALGDCRCGVGSFRSGGAAGLWPVPDPGPSH